MSNLRLTSQARHSTIDSGFEDQVVEDQHAPFQTRLTDKFPLGKIVVDFSAISEKSAFSHSLIASLSKRLRLAFVLPCSTSAAEPTPMFKIRRSDGQFVVFALSGRITAARLPELQALLESEAHDHAIALDLRELKLVDRDAVRFLADCETKGMKLANCPAYIRAWIEKEAAQSEEGS